MSIAPTSDAPDSTPPLLELARDRATIRLNRPRHRNRIERADVDVLLELLASVEANPELRVLVLTGTGSMFCAGYDLGALKTEAADTVSADPGPDVFERMVDRIEDLRIPTICALNGGVYGGATDMALACDFRIGVEGMELGMPASRLGVHYYLSGMRRYVTRLGLGAAKRLFLTGVPMPAEKLMEIGYLDELVPAGALAARVDALATLLGSRAPLAVQGMKRALNAIARGNPDARQVDDDVLRCMPLGGSPRRVGGLEGETRAGVPGPLRRDYCSPTPTVTLTSMVSVEAPLRTPRTGAADQ
ncbi:MAG TPA: enoyl-CoA hydratase/isomerase family protein [Stellaceae bacterium]|nr:enoyl-CoA hydratase/isomerase family protein [Stellaceae bacterium]